jgi:hypothetical protein
MSYNLPIIHYTFDVDGRNNGSLGSALNITTIPSDILFNSANKLIGDKCISIFTVQTTENASTYTRSSDNNRLVIPTWTTPNNFTISVWAKIPARISTGQSLMEWTVGGKAFALVFWTSITNFLIYYNESLRIITIPNMYDGLYHHYLFTVASNGDITMYIDTNLQNSGPVNHNPSPTNTSVSATYIGSRTNTDPHINGYIDDFKVYDYIADAALRSVIYKVGKATSVTQLINEGATPAQLRAAGISFNQLAGYLQWLDLSDTSNRLKQSYIKDLIDISGSFVLRDKANLYVEGNTTVKGNLRLNNTILQTDLSFNNRILVGGDISMNGNATIANDVSLNGVVTGCIFPDNSIPTTAFVNAVTSPSPDYTKASVIYQQKFRALGDVSMNGDTVQATNITVNGNIEFNDGTKMSTYDDNRTVKYTTKTTNYVTPTGIPSTINIHDDTDNKAISFDGKYILLVGGSVNNNDHTTDTETSKRSGILLSSDYGVSYTFFYLKHPTLNTDLIKHAYRTSAMSGDGKYMIVFISGTGAGTSSDMVYGISNNYGESWITNFQSTLPGFSGLNLFPRNVALNYDGSKAILHAIAGGGVYRSAISQNFMVSWSSLDIGVENVLQLQIIGNYYTFRSGTSTFFRNFDGDTTKNKTYTGYCSYACAAANNIIAIICNNATITKLVVTDNTITETNISTVNTANHVKVSATVSPSGKYILIGMSKNLGNLINDITLFTGENKSVYCSDNYGESFTTVTTGIINGSFPGSYYLESTISDTGFIFIGSYYSAGRNILRYSFQLFKESAFTGLTIKNTLTAPTYLVSSDYRIKNNVAKLDNMFTVDYLRPVKYFQTLLNKQQYGLIAHELQQYYPDLVIGEKDGSALQHLNYTGLIAILINEIIRLKREFTELEKKRQTAQSNQDM